MHFHNGRVWSIQGMVYADGYTYASSVCATDCHRGLPPLPFLLPPGFLGYLPYTFLKTVNIRPHNPPLYFIFIACFYDVTHLLSFIAIPRAVLQPELHWVHADFLGGFVY